MNRAAFSVVYNAASGETKCFDEKVVGRRDIVVDEEGNIRSILVIVLSAIFALPSAAQRLLGCKAVLQNGASPQHCHVVE